MKIDNMAKVAIPAIGSRPKSRVSTNLTEQNSRRFTGDSRRDFKKNPGHLHCFGLLCIESTTFNGCCLPSTVFVLADTYRAGMLTLEIIVILFTRYCLSDLVPSFMTGNQCGWASYTKISRRTIKFKEISGFPGGFLNSSRFPGFPGVVDTL